MLKSTPHTEIAVKNPEEYSTVVPCLHLYMYVYVLNGENRGLFASGLHEKYLVPQLEGTVRFRSRLTLSPFGTRVESTNEVAFWN